MEFVKWLKIGIVFGPRGAPVFKRLIVDLLLKR